MVGLQEVRFHKGTYHMARTAHLLPHWKFFLREHKATTCGDPGPQHGGSICDVGVVGGEHGDSSGDEHPRAKTV